MNNKTNKNKVEKLSFKKYYEITTHIVKIKYNRD